MTSSAPALWVLVQLQLRESRPLIQLHLLESGLLILVASPRIDAFHHEHDTRVHPVALLGPLDPMPQASQKPGA
jgi:hypothetical protein